MEVYGSVWQAMSNLYKVGLGSPVVVGSGESDTTMSPATILAVAGGVGLIFLIGRPKRIKAKRDMAEFVRVNPWAK